MFLLLVFPELINMKIKLVVAVFTILIIQVAFPITVNSQGFIVDWSNPEALFSTPDGQKSNELWVLGDQEDTLYLWWPIFDVDTEEEPRNSLIERTLHTQRIKEEWRSPMDVMVWPDAGRLTSAVVDQSGILHAFSATDCLSYVNARHDEALSARAWGERSCLDQAGLSNPSVVQAQEGTIYVLYSTIENHSFRLINSKDGGATWSSYITVEENLDNFLLDPMMAIDNEGRLHVVWSVGQAPDAYPPVGVYYSRSNNEGENWTVPILLGGVDEGQPAIAVFNDDVHVLWNGDAAKRGRYYRYSEDAGESWGSVEVLSPPSSQGGRGGLQRPPAIVVDNLGNVHALLHEQESLFYTSKIDQNWTAKQSLYIPEIMRAAEVFAVRLAITGGNHLHAIYLLASYHQINTEDRSNLIWTLFHQSREIDTNPVPPVPWRTPEQEEIGSLIETKDDLEVSETITARPPQNVNVNEDLVSTNSYNPAWSIYVGVTSASVFIFILLVLFFVKQRR
jgi:hypothetical protein